MDVEQHQKKEDDSNDFGFIFAGISDLDGYKRNARYNWS